MPTRPPKLCSYPGCTRLCKGARCDAHLTAHGSPLLKPWAKIKGSAHSRGYGAAWRRLRLRILGRDPICRICRRAWSKTVDHIKPKAQGGGDEDENLQGVCEACHRTKTANEVNAARAAQPPRPVGVT